MFMADASALPGPQQCLDRRCQAKRLEYHAKCKIVMVIPIIMNIIPMALPRSCSFILLANLALAMPLMAALKPMTIPAIGLTLPCKAYPTVPEQAVIAIIRAEVPMAM